MPFQFSSPKLPSWLRRSSTPSTKPAKSLGQAAVPALQAEGSPATGEDRPPLALSVVVICYKMEGQVGNTVRSLSVPYQRGIAEEDYEVVVVDNGSPTPLGDEASRFPGNVRYEYVAPADAPPNPGVAINRAVRRARGEVVCVMIDGARMLTPGVLQWGLALTRTNRRAMVEVRGWHLGPKSQVQSVPEGYNHEVERELLRQANWLENGYRLFGVGAPAESCKTGFLGKATETTCAFMSRETYLSIGGYDERYAEPGGGLANFDFFWRATTAASVVFTLLGEGTFHQVHGGAATGLSPESRRETYRRWKREYERLSRPFDKHGPPYEPVLAGHVSPECLRWLTPREDEGTG